MDELKKLARVWKLNERRNFWKQHFTKEALMGALLQHIHDNNSFGAAAAGYQQDSEETYHAPMPPTELKPSHAAQDTKPRLRVKMRRICGYPVLNPVRNHQDILTKSRFKNFPTVDNSLSSQLSEWRVADFNKGSASISEKETVNKASDTKIVVSQVKIEKRRALAQQLLEYSLQKKNTKEVLSRHSIETFLNVAETEDFDTAEYSAAALSNICSNPQTRLMLIDLNAIHKYTALLPLLKTPAAAWASTLFFYYLSCESDIEDRIYNAGFNTLMLNSMTSDLSLCAAALTGLANLLPCSERHRVAEQIVRSALRFGTSHLTTHPEQSRTILSVIQRAAAFTNVHTTLLNLELMDFISLVVANQDRNDPASGKLLSSILTSFLHSPDSYEDFIQSDYVHIFIELLAFEDDDIVMECLAALAVLSGNADSVQAVLERDVVEVVCGLTSFRDLTKDMALYVSKYFANICRPGIGNIQSVVDAGVHVALLQLLERHYDVSIRRFTLRALRGILSVEAFCKYFCVASIPPLVSAILNREELEAITCLQHISVVPACLPQLFAHDVHASIFSILHSDKLNALSNAAVVGYLRIILQIAAGSPERSQALLRMRATECLCFVLQECSKGEDASANTAIDSKRRSVVSAEKRLFIRLTQMPEVCKIVSRVLVCLITAIGKDGSALQPETRAAAIDIVKLISASGAESVVIDECCLVLASISAFGITFESAHPILQNFLNCSSSDAMTESMSVVVYNMACQEDNIEGMLENAFYLNLMIRMMRSGLMAAQDNIVDAFRILCCYQKCSSLLMKQDLLSDLIVIALLRTSSEKIKTVCCEALYNMLCQSEEIRFNLLKGDLWWAIMRLTKTDIERVREVCCSALLNLSMERDNIAALRRNHVINFLKEFTATGRGSFIEPCLITIQNILNNADTDMLHSELIMVVEVCSSILTRCDTILSVSIALNLIARILLTLTESGLGIAELTNCEISKVLSEAKNYWQGDAKCRETVSFLLQTACCHVSFVSTTPLSDIIPLCNILLYGPMSRKHFSRSDSRGDSVLRKDPLEDAAAITDSIVERENVASVLMRYMAYGTEANEAALRQLIKTGLFHSTVTGPLCVSGRLSVVSVAAFARSDTFDDEDKDKTEEETAAENPSVELRSTSSKRDIIVSKELRKSCLSVYAHAVPLLLTDAEAKMKDEAELRQYMAAKAGRQANEMTLADLAFTNSWYGLLPLDFPSFYSWDAESLANSCFIIGAYSNYQVLSGFLLDASVFAFLASMMDIAFAESCEGGVQHGGEEVGYERGCIEGAFSASRLLKKKNSGSESINDINIDLYNDSGDEDNTPDLKGAAQIINVWEDAPPAPLVLAARFCSAMLRNISEHPHLMPQIVSADGIERLLYLLIQVEDEVMARDLSLVLYRCSHEELSSKTNISPKVVYDISSQMSTRGYLGHNLSRVYRHIVAVSLENFAHEIGATPEHVKAVYDEMLENENFDITAVFREWIIDDGALGLHAAVRSSTDPFPLADVALPTFPEVSVLWVMVRTNTLKHLDSIEFSSQSNIDSEETGDDFFSVVEYPAEKETPRVLRSYTKIICLYPYVDTSTGVQGPSLPKRSTIAKMTSHFDPFASYQSVSSAGGSLADNSGSTSYDPSRSLVKEQLERPADPVP